MFTSKLAVVIMAVEVDSNMYPWLSNDLVSLVVEVHAYSTHSIVSFSGFLVGPCLSSCTF